MYYPGNELPNIGFRSWTGTCCFVFNDIPVLDQDPSSMTRMSAAIQLAGAPKPKSVVNDHKIASHDHVVLVFQRVRKTF